MRFTRAQLVAAISAAVVLVLVLAVAFWPRSSETVSTLPEPTFTDEPFETPLETLTPTPTPTVTSTPTAKPSIKKTTPPPATLTRRPARPTERPSEPAERPRPGGPIAAFAGNSFWYDDIRRAPVASNSKSVIANLVSQVKMAAPTINTTNYAAPIYVTSSSTPRVNVGFDNCQNKKYPEPGFVSQMKNVPIPSHAVPAGGRDKEVVFYSPSEDTLWELWRATKSGSKWTACWGGKITNVSKGHGAFQHPYGITAAGLSMYGGTIRPDELAAGRIDHAIGIALPRTAKWPNWSWPANRTDGYNPDGATVPFQGQRLRLDPDLNVDSLNIHPVAKTIAKAAQKHGFIVWDTAGAVSVRADNPLAYTSAGKADPYKALWNGAGGGWEVIRGFPWDKLEAMPVNYGKP